MRDDFPDPETPVTAVIVASGTSMVTFLRLFRRAPRTVSFQPLPFLRTSGTGISRAPLRY
jgi:hypothetical protein